MHYLSHHDALHEWRVAWFWRFSKSYYVSFLFVHLYINKKIVLARYTESISLHDFVQGSSIISNRGRKLLFPNMTSQNKYKCMEPHEK